MHHNGISLENQVFNENASKPISNYCMFVLRLKKLFTFVYIFNQPLRFQKKFLVFSVEFLKISYFLISDNQSVRITKYQTDKDCS